MSEPSNLRYGLLDPGDENQELTAGSVGLNVTEEHGEGTTFVVTEESTLTEGSCNLEGDHQQSLPSTEQEADMEDLEQSGPSEESSSVETVVSQQDGRSRERLSVQRRFVTASQLSSASLRDSDWSNVCNSPPPQYESHRHSSLRQQHAAYSSLEEAKQHLGTAIIELPPAYSLQRRWWKLSSFFFVFFFFVAAAFLGTMAGMSFAGVFLILFSLSLMAALTSCYYSFVQYAQQILTTHGGVDLSTGRVTLP